MIFRQEFISRDTVVRGSVPAAGDEVAKEPAYEFATERTFDTGTRTLTPSPPLIPMRNPYQIDPAQLEHEARAKIFWGDEPQEVIKYLRMQGITLEEAVMLVESMSQERAETIRGMGLRKILVGIALVCVPIIAWIVFNNAGVIPLKLFAITIMVGLYGAWLLLKGSMMFFAPKSEPGDVSSK